MSVQVESSKYKSRNFSYVLQITNPITVIRGPNEITVSISPDDAQELHGLLGTELGCTDCSCCDYGYEQGQEVGSQA